jgi:hypothetical protein
MSGIERRPSRDRQQGLFASNDAPQPRRHEGWLISKKGQPYYRDRGYTAVIYKWSNGFVWRLSAWSDPLDAIVSKPFPNVDDAKAAAILAMTQARALGSVRALGGRRA